MSWLTFLTVLAKTAGCQGPNRAPDINSHRRPRDVLQPVSAETTSILLFCSIKSTKLLYFTLKALKLLPNVMTSKGKASRTLWFSTSTRYSIKRKAIDNSINSSDNIEPVVHSVMLKLPSQSTKEKNLLLLEEKADVNQGAYILWYRWSIESYRDLLSAFPHVSPGLYRISHGCSIFPLTDTKRIIQKTFPRIKCVLTQWSSLEETWRESDIVGREDAELYGLPHKLIHHSSRSEDCGKSYFVEGSL